MNIASPIESFEIILLLAAVVAIVARQLKLPYSVGLLIAGDSGSGAF